MCESVDQWKRPNLPTSRIRQDIDRFPSGDAHQFQTFCRNCHGAMDGLAGAFSKITFENEKITWLSEVAPKYLIHSEFYPDGYVTVDESWINFLTGEGQSYYGWKSATQGLGIKNLGDMFAQSEQFARCMVKRTVKTVCKKDLDVQNKIIKELAAEFSSNGYKLRDLFIAVAIGNVCL
ncbi:MAG: hypothetical protein AABZ55_13735 [Bdellovibrionota bacterium]